MVEFNLSEKRKELRKNIRNDIFKWGIKEGGDKLHFNEIVDEIFNDLNKQDEEFIKRLKAKFQLYFDAGNEITYGDCEAEIDKLAGDKLK